MIWYDRRFGRQCNCGRKGKIENMASIRVGGEIAVALCYLQLPSFTNYLSTFATSWLESVQAIKCEGILRDNNTPAFFLCEGAKSPSWL